MSRLAEDPAPTAPADRARGILIHSEETQGAFALLEYDIPPGKLVAPLHTHAREDEYSFILEGTVGCQIGAKTVTAGPRELLSKPRRVPHTLWNPGGSSARVLELIVPGGFERCLEMLRRTDARPRVSSPADVARLMGQYEIEMDGASVAGLLRRHGLTGVEVS